MDTAAKRLASLEFSSVWLPCAPIPDGTIGQADWYHMLASYFVTAVTPAITGYKTLIVKAMDYTLAVIHRDTDLTTQARDITLATPKR